MLQKQQEDFAKLYIVSQNQSAKFSTSSGSDTNASQRSSKNCKQHFEKRILLRVLDSCVTPFSHKLKWEWNSTGVKQNKLKNQKVIKNLKERNINNLQGLSWRTAVSYGPLEN